MDAEGIDIDDIKVCPSKSAETGPKVDIHSSHSPSSNRSKLSTRQDTMECVLEDEVVLRTGGAAATGGPTPPPVNKRKIAAAILKQCKTGSVPELPEQKEVKKTLVSSKSLEVDDF